MKITDSNSQLWLKISHSINILKYLLLAPLILSSVTLASADPLEVTHLNDQINKVRASVTQAEELIKRQAPEARFIHREDRLGPALILGMDLTFDASSPQQRAEEFIKRFKGLWGLMEIQLEEAQSRKGRTVFTLRGSIDGLQLLNQDSRLSIMGEKIQHLSNGMGALAVIHRASITQENAEISVRKEVSKTEGLNLEIKLARRGIISHVPGIAFEVFEFSVADITTLRSKRVLVDGRDGVVIEIREGEVR